MNRIFIDTAFLLALSSPKDELYAKSMQWRLKLTLPLVTSEFVLLEVADGFASRKAPHIAQQIIDSLRRSSTTIIAADSTWFARGYKIFLEMRGNNWSLTDCISFEMMREMGITDALTHDHHFEQAGFRALLREDPPGN